MVALTISKGGQVSLPAEIRRRWGVARLMLIDHGDRVELRPLPDDPIAALRGIFKDVSGPPTEVLLADLRREDAALEERRGLLP